MKKATKKFPLEDLYKYLKENNNIDLFEEIKNKQFDYSTSRRGFAIIMLREEGIFNDFINYAQKLYPGKTFIIDAAINKYNQFESVPEAEYIELNYNGKTRFTPAEIKKLKYYVYELIDPRNGKIFYVGKGKANRVYKHLKAALKGEPSEKSYKIRDILKEELKPTLNIVKSGLSENEAFQLENLLITQYGKNNLTNINSGKNGS